MTFFLNVSYDEKHDEFFAYVDDGQRGDTIFQIDDTDEMVDLIQKGIMCHIDDINGLKEHLIGLKIIEPTDTLYVNEVLLW